MYVTILSEVCFHYRKKVDFVNVTKHLVDSSSRLCASDLDIVTALRLRLSGDADHPKGIKIIQMDYNKRPAPFVDVEYSCTSKTTEYF